jgi:hypothetical protein
MCFSLSLAIFVWIGRPRLSTLFCLVVAFPLSSCDQKRESRFLSDIDPAYHYLEQLQQAAESDSWRSRYKGTDAQRKTAEDVLHDLANRSTSLATKPADLQVLREAEKHILEQVLPTRLEDPFNYNIIVTKSRQIAEAANKVGITVPRQPKFGTLLTPTVNAETLRVPGTNDSLIVVNKDTLILAYEMAKLALLTMRIEQHGDNVNIDASESQFESSLQDNPDLLTRFSMQILEFLGEGGSGRIPFPAQYDVLIGAAAAGIETFIIGHEYGVVALRIIAGAGGGGMNPQVLSGP